ncbi:MAG: hypothetical protein NWE86_00370, partial [Candidatus Bathyarchaeota archaeon]|nr:hypothetical protein [Candidatus Bathyarchaeota archaeon]
MSKSQGPWKGITIVLLVLVIAMAGIGGYIYYQNIQKVNNLENTLHNTQNELSFTQSELSRTRNELLETKNTLDFSQIILQGSSENLSSMETLIEEYKATELRNPTLEELSAFLSEDKNNEGNYTTFTEWIELNLKLKDNAKGWNIRAGLVTVKYNCEYGGELREGGWTLVLVTELNDGEMAYFSPENDEIYDS